ncbi:MAG: hypothetical protein LAT68_01420 [Cyclobacteriaceae bacterium]|nr:hypothetical protein [Cyclobacteriaceae bacterium]MCH8514963.1 hypothetical protein [Cyclobacteriaceae bacterium]
MQSRRAIQRSPKIPTTEEQIRANIEERKRQEQAEAQAPSENENTATPQAAASGLTISPTTLKDAIEQFKEKQGTQLAAGAKVVLGQSFEFASDRLIRFSLNGKTHEPYFEALKNPLLGFLKSYFALEDLQIDYEIKEQSQVEMRYTPKEKLKYLMKKYPKLQELQERFGLDTDF